MVKIYCQVLGTKTLDSDPSVLLFFDNKRYLFNVGEGTMRFCTEHKIRLAKISHLFLTDLCPETLGGLPGLLLTLADSRSASNTNSSNISTNAVNQSIVAETTASTTLISLFGPTNTLFYLATLRWFVKRRDLLVALTEAINEDDGSSSKSAQQQQRPEFIFADENVSVEAVSVCVPSAACSANNDCDQTTTTMIQRYLNEASAHSPLLQDFIIKKSSNHQVSQTEANDTDHEPECKRRRLDDENENQTSTFCSPSTVFAYRDRLNLLLNEKRVECTYGAPLTSKSALLPKSIDSSVSYICHTPLLPGKFDAKKAKELGIKPGPLYGQLSRGESVTMDDGRVVTPDQVVGQARPGPIVAVVSCPSVSFLNGLVNHKKWGPYLQGKQRISVMIHMAKSELINDPIYVSFMKKFGKDCQHLLINQTHSVDKCVFESSANIQCKLNLIDNEIFGVPHVMKSTINSNEQEKTNGTDKIYAPQPVKELETKLGKGYKVWRTDNLMKFTLEPQAQFGIDVNSAIVPDICCSTVQNNFSKETHSILHELFDQYKLTKSNIMNRFKTQPESNHEKMIASISNSHETEIVFLGTGSALPSKYRNVSSILFKSPDHTILMDCGEGTLGQMYRVYGKEETDDILLNQMKCVWLSHMHADHHLGLAKILNRRCQLYLESEEKEPLRKVLVIGPYILHQYLIEFEIACHQIHQPNTPQLSDTYEFVLIDKLINPDHTETSIVSNLYSANSDNGLQMVRFYNIAVDHSCKNSYGLILQFSNGLKIVYSGDTRPCQQLINAGQDATVLIHEATFEDTLQDEAIKKKHSTTKEAVTSGMQMNAFRIMLTHFSQRYPKVPVFDDDDMKGSATNRTSIAFDMMRVSLKSLLYAPAVIPAVQELFAEEIAEQS